MLLSQNLNSKDIKTDWFHKQRPFILYFCMLNLRVPKFFSDVG